MLLAEIRIMVLPGRKPNSEFPGGEEGGRPEVQGYEYLSNATVLINLGRVK